MTKQNFATITAVLLVVLMMSTASATWVNYKLIEGVVPSHVYPVNLNAGDTFQANLAWSTRSADLDLYFYESGQNLLSRTTFLSNQSQLTTQP